jgi:hypothetical protein
MTTIHTTPQFNVIPPVGVKLAGYGAFLSALN